MHKRTAIYLVISFLSIINIAVTGEETGIKEIPVFNYITGRFNPSRHVDFINLKKTTIPCTGEMYLRKETSSALKLLLDDFKKEHKNITIRIVSATRNFYSQKSIWDKKWTGKRKISNIYDINKITDPLQKSLKILEYSSMPGTSRHHWGTDFDINQLNNTYYTKGEGLIIYEWLKKNAKKYGFAQPYTEQRTGGYKEEKWHWSYLPLAKLYLKEWNTVYNNKPDLFTEPGLFCGSEVSGHLSPLYVNSINPECK